MGKQKSTTTKSGVTIPPEDERIRKPIRTRTEIGMVVVSGDNNSVLNTGKSTGKSSIVYAKNANASWLSRLAKQVPHLNELHAGIRVLRQNPALDVVDKRLANAIGMRVASAVTEATKSKPDKVKVVTSLRKASRVLDALDAGGKDRGRVIRKTKKILKALK